MAAISPFSRQANVKGAFRAKNHARESRCARGGFAACWRTGAVLQHRRSLGPVDPRCIRQHECQAAERRDPHRGGAARDQGRGRVHSRAGAAVAAHVWRAVGGAAEKLPGHPSRRAVRPRERGRRRRHGIGGRRESARLHADRLFARTSRQRFPGRRQGARHRAGQRRQGNLPGRSGRGGEGAGRQGHHRPHRGLYRRHRRPRAAAGHRAGHRRHLFRRAGRAGIAGHAQVRRSAPARRES